jgi:hypothetical protein
MRSLSVVGIFIVLIAAAASAQTDRGTITGTVTDSARAVIPSASIEAKNTESGAVYLVKTTVTGNYTLPQLPPGTYQLSVTVPGFKQFVRTGITVMSAQTLRIDVTLEVGNITETVTVNADAPLLRTESGDLSHNVTSQRLNDLPVLSLAAGGIRDPYAAMTLLPGTNYVTSVGGAMGNIRINGQPGNTQSLRIEGQDATNGMWSSWQSMTQPSVDAIEEFSIQTSNFAAEFGQAGGGIFNVTMRSGTNAIHGGAYEYFVNEALNANQGYTNNRPRSRKNDFGFTFGGPVYIPHVYDGHDRTFFFFNFEQFRQTTTYINPMTLPTQAMRNGDFSAVLTNRKLATDPLGRDIMENAIYDPDTERTVNGLRVRDPFPNNQIDPARFDPVAVKIQAMIPAPMNSNRTYNYVPNELVPRNQTIPGVKIDHYLSPKIKLSGYWSLTKLSTIQMPGGIDSPITIERGNPQWAHTVRLNYDHTVTPTMILHLGAGVMHVYNDDMVKYSNFDPVKEIGLKGTYSTKFPRITGASGPLGGMGSMGANQQWRNWATKPTANASLTWVKSNHTYKTGAEMRIDGFPALQEYPAYGSIAFSALQTGLPSTQGQSLGGGSVGYSYASFLLGLANSGSISYPLKGRVGKSAWALFVQDTWKVTRKFTLDYGIRWDYQTYLREQYGRWNSFSFTMPNPAAGGLPGAYIFEANSGAFADVYPYAIGPRLGAAWQITRKTVFRAGWGISYGQTYNPNFWCARTAAAAPFTSPAYGDPAMVMRDGIPIVPKPWPDLDPGQAPVDPSSPSGVSNQIDRNAGRPPRQMMWSIGLQRQITTNLAIEASYVGNRGAWWYAGSLTDYNRLTPEILANNGLDINKAADRTLLTSRLDSPTAAARGFNKPPYAAFALSNTVAQSLRPFPQFTSFPSMNMAPLGRTWYDSLQVKVTKRYSHGLDASVAFSWQKELVIGSEAEDPGFQMAPGYVNDVLDYKSNKYISGNSQPLSIVFAANYRFPTLAMNKFLSYVIRDWTLGAVLRYANGFPIRVPSASSSVLQQQLMIRSNTFANRVPGEPLFTTDINCTSCFDPNKDFVLNPNAWTDPPAGQFSNSTAYYNDYRRRRSPSENMSLGRTFRIAEKATLNIRVEFSNIFNRINMGTPTSTNAGATQSRNAQGVPIAGFGYINTTGGSTPRTGQLVARFQF